MTSVLLISDNSSRSAPLAGIIKERLHYPLRALPVAALSNLSSGELGSFDILILDISSEAVQALANEIRQIRKYVNTISILVLYPFGDTDAEALAAHAGADDMLARPISFERLQFTLKNLMRIKQIHLAALSQGGMLINKGKTVALLDDQGKMKKIRALEAEAIVYALEYYHGQIAKVARALGIGRSTLYRKMDEMNINYRPVARISSRGGPGSVGVL